MARLNLSNNFQPKLNKFNGEILCGDKVVAKVVEDYVDVIDKDRAPLFFSNKTSFNDWVRGRCFDSSRANVRLMKRILNIRTGNSYEMAIRFHAISLTDHFWCRSDCEEDLIYECVSSLDDRLSRSALFGEYVEFYRDNTPEVSNLGSFEKCWKRENGVWFLKKLANENELISEIFVSCLCEVIGLPNAFYEYDEINNCVSSKNFLRVNEDLQEIKDVLGEDDDFETSYLLISSLGDNFIKQYFDLLFMDAVCYNFDRHTGNYGFITDSNTGKIISLTPNYDNNNSLISREIRSSKMAPKGFLNGYKKFFKKHNYEPPIIDNDVIDKAVDLCKLRLKSFNMKNEFYIKNFVLNNYMYLF